MKQAFTVAGTFLLVLSISTFSGAQISGTPVQSATRLQVTGPLGFIENKGQFLDQNKKKRTDLLYMFQRNGMKVQLMPNAISFETYTRETNPAAFDEAKGFPHYADLDEEDRPEPARTYKSSRIDVEFIGANPAPEVVAEEVMADYLNYYLAYTPVEGITKVKQYNRITYKNLYDHIDLVLIATPNQNPTGALAYDFVVHPGGNVNDIKYRYHGTNNQHLSNDGVLETGTSHGKIAEMIPESYLQNQAGVKLSPVDVSFDLNKSQRVIGFHADNYDKKLSLVIDPLFIWATYCGGDSSEEGRGLTTDSIGNVAIIGRSNSTNNIATVGAFQAELADDVDIILEKYDSAGHRYWGTYYGGSKADHGRGLITDHLDNFYLGCHTDSEDGVATPGAYRENYAGGSGDDGLLAYFSADGFRIFGTYYGGDQEEIIRRICVDYDGNVIMTGYSYSDTGIATPGTWQNINYGDGDVLISKWTPDGQLMWGSFLGGTGQDHGRSADIDKDNNIYINGSTGSPGIATPGVARENYSDKQDFLLARMSTDGQIGWISYWGGTVEDRGRGVFVDSSSKYVYFMGYSASDTGVATPGAYQETWTEGYDAQDEPFHDMVLMKWTLDGTQVKWSTYLGDVKDDRGRSITMIGDNEIYLSGSTESPGTVIPTPDGFQTVWGGKGDMFLEIWDSNGIRSYGTYFGSTGDEDNLALAVDHSGHNVYLIGTGGSQNLGTPGTAQPELGGFDDCLLVKIQLHLAPLAPVAFFLYENLPCDTGAVQFINISSNSDTYSWSFGDNTFSTDASPIHSYTAPGDYEVTLIATNSITSISDTATQTITVFNATPEAVITPAGSTTFCEGGSVLLNANLGAGYLYKWKLGTSFISGATNSSYIATETGSYKVFIQTPSGCTVLSQKVDVLVAPLPVSSIFEGPAVSFCDGSMAILTANIDSPYAYQWLYQGAPIPGATSAILFISAAGDYVVVETNSYDCSDTSDITVVTIYPNPPVLATATDSSVCLNETVTLSGSGALDYLWQPGNISGQSIEVSPTSQTTYIVTGTDGNGCKADDEVTIDVLPLPVVQLGNDTIICDTANFILDAGSGFTSYLWSTGVQTQTITVPSTTDDYWVKVTDANGCTGTDTINIVVAICTGIENISLLNQINIYPNPTTGSFTLSFRNPHEEKVKVELENILGQKVMDIYEGQTGNQFTSEISSGFLPSGVYYVKFSIGKEIMTRKLVIER